MFFNVLIYKNKNVKIKIHTQYSPIKGTVGGASQRGVGYTVSPNFFLNELYTFYDREGLANIPQ